jgi:hypothetical protein
VWDLLIDLVRSVIREGECVSLFAIAILLIVVMHAQNTRRIDRINMRLKEHTDQCPNGRD